MNEIIWNDFEQQGQHQWVYDDKALKSRYAIRSIDGVIEATIRDELTSDPTGPEIEAFLVAVNAYRKKKRIAESRE